MVAPNILDDTMLSLLKRRFGDEQMENAPSGNFGSAGGFLAVDYHDPLLIDLLTWPKTLEVLRGFGYKAPKLHSYYVSAKPPGSGPLAWHSDLFYEYDEVEPAELFLIYYLQDTSVENGCLRIIPGSHLWSHGKRHQRLEAAKMYQGEVSVPVKAGDLFIGDRRILHATHSNRSDGWRTCITIAYVPDFARLAEPIQALIIKNPCLPSQDETQKSGNSIDEKLKPLIALYTGSAEPIKIVHRTHA